MKRILFLDHTPFVGGAQLALWDHIRHLDRARFEPQVLCAATVPEFIERMRRHTVRTHLLDWPRLRRPTPLTLARVVRAGVYLRRVIHERDIDLVVANTSRTAYTAAAAMLGSPVPLVWWVRDFDFGRRWFRALRRVPSRIIFVSNALRSYYDGWDESKYDVVYVGNDLYEKLATYSPDQVRSARARCGFSADDVVVGFMGRLVEGKGPEDLVDAVAQLRSEFPRLRLVFVGTGKGQTGDVEDRLRHRVAAAGLIGVVHFAGHQSEEGLYYQIFDVFVLSSRYREAMATSVIQAMMARTPVIATRTGGTPEVVLDGETGILVPPSDPNALSEAIRRVLRGPAAATRMAAAAYDHVMAHHRQDAVTRRAEAVYESVLQII
ncbi:MAG TPA: glycosyltransferase family 4 protein [Gemmatimonadaceae bacterium]|nr:glycosyltransferase family 4 protein [Gemmatimonadaceae bacterium]